MAKKNTTTFIDNMKLPIHRWFRYSAGFSALWVENVLKERIKERNYDKTQIRVLDPFSGSGTTLLASDHIGVRSVGFESHPLIYRIAEAKINWNINIEKFSEMSTAVLNRAKDIQGNYEGYPDLIYKCYTEDNIRKLDSIKQAINEICNNDEDREAKLCWLILVSILRNASHAGTAQWQYVLPNKTKVKVVDAYEAYARQAEMMIDDILYVKNTVNIEEANKSILYNHDCRAYNENLGENSIDFVITSPPYANNYDYADATRLELSFLGEISGWSDLQSYVRPYLMRSCTQHVSSLKKETFEIIKNDILSPIYDEILEVCTLLDEEKEHHGGKKNYHTMIATYFLDIANVLRNLRVYCKDGAEMCFVIGDSAPYGIYVPVDRWIGELALSVGFKSYSFEKTRDRNTKWKNRKHDVLLKEGYLWIRG